MPSEHDDARAGQIEALRRYVADLASVLQAGGHNEVTNVDSLAKHCREDHVATYLRLSRDAIDAAVWLKRYAEALSESTAPTPEARP